MSLVRKELIRAERATLPGEDAFRFRHALIREAAYTGLSKEARSELHERHAAWLERTLGDRVTEAEEILGYHLEQAYRYRAELGPLDEKTHELADRALLRLGSAGRLAFRRGDSLAAVNLLERARSLPSTDERPGSSWPPTSPLLSWLAASPSGRGRPQRRDRARDGRRGTRGAPRLAGALPVAQCSTGRSRSTLRPRSVRPRSRSHVFEAAGDDLALTRAMLFLSALYPCTGEAAPLREAAERGLAHARRAGSRLDEAWSLARVGYALLDGPTSADDGVRRCEELLRELRSDPLGSAISALLASLVAMQGRFEDACAASSAAELGCRSSRRARSGPSSS